MALLDALRQVGRIREQLLAQGAGLDPFGVPVESVRSATEATIDGHPIVMAGTNNYLGLTFDGDCISAAEEALRESGTGTTGSRMANGSYAHHIALERELA